MLQKYTSSVSDTQLEKHKRENGGGGGARYNGQGIFTPTLSAWQNM